MSHLADKFNTPRSIGRRQALAERTAKTLAAVYGDFGNGTGELWGSGGFLKIRGQIYLGTAGHVAVGRLGYRRLAHSTKDGEEPRNITRGFRVQGKPPWGADDIAVTRLDPDALDIGDWEPATASCFGTSFDISPEEPLFVHGYPEWLSFALGDRPGLRSRALPMQTVLATSDWPSLDPAKHFAVGYARSGVDRDFQQLVVPEPYGLSGSFVWRMHSDDSNPNWLASDARIVGVLQKWDRGSQSLIATRIEVFREFLTRHLRLERAYFRWHDNGRRDGTTLTDWVEAERAITDID